MATFASILAHTTLLQANLTSGSHVSRFPFGGLEGHWWKYHRGSCWRYGLTVLEAPGKRLVLWGPEGPAREIGGVTGILLLGQKLGAPVILATGAQHWLRVRFLLHYHEFR